jgi:hypothetical protein
MWKETVFWYVTPYDTAEIYRRFEINYCLRLDGTIKTGAAGPSAVSKILTDSTASYLSRSFVYVSSTGPKTMDDVKH